MHEHTFPSPPGSLYTACAGRVGKSPPWVRPAITPFAAEACWGSGATGRQKEAWAGSAGVCRAASPGQQVSAQTTGGCRLSRPRALLPLRRCSVGLDAQLAPGVWSQCARAAGEQHRLGWRCGAATASSPEPGSGTGGAAQGVLLRPVCSRGRSSAGEEGGADRTTSPAAWRPPPL